MKKREIEPYVPAVKNCVLTWELSKAKNMNDVAHFWLLIARDYTKAK